MVLFRPAVFLSAAGLACLAGTLLALSATESGSSPAGEAVTTEGNSAVMSRVPDARIHPWLMNRLQAGNIERIIVRLAPAPVDPSALPADPVERKKIVHALLRRHADRTQGPLLGWLAAHGVAVVRSWSAVNAVLIRGNLDLARAVAGRVEVIELSGDPWVRGLDESVASPLLAPAAIDSGPEWGIVAINADDVWATYNKHGEGVVVMSADTGVDWTHPAIQGKYRGWNGTSADHSYSWHDAIQNLAVPLDDHSHGTHTTGTMTGDDGAGNQVGVAPGAKWVACRNMDHGNGQPSTYIDCIDWALAPYPANGDPILDAHPELAPDVINNSWGCPASEGCSVNTLKDAFDSILAAGIMPVVSNGNNGPSCETTGDPPALYASSFSVGATDINTQIASFSSRGPVTQDGSNRRKPNVSAPGVNVRSSVPGGGYSNFSGTSMAGPHTVGAVALMWSVRPQLRPLLRITECLLQRTAHPVGNSFAQTCGSDAPGARPNNIWGWGLIDVLAALQYGPDGDVDGIADSCDCAAADGGAFESPSEVWGVSVAADEETVSWASQAATAGTGTRYDVSRGSVAALRSSGNWSGASCYAQNQVVTTVIDTALPSTGDSTWYLVRARNGCGVGSWGNSSNGTARSITACP